jgi:hypothetical protein
VIFSIYSPACDLQDSHPRDWGLVVQKIVLVIQLELEFDHPASAQLWLAATNLSRFKGTIRCSRLVQIQQMPMSFLFM